jgi:hypothetical protein
LDDKQHLVIDNGSAKLMLIHNDVIAKLKFIHLLGALMPRSPIKSVQLRSSSSEMYCNLIKCVSELNKQTFVG